VSSGAGTSASGAAPKARMSKRKGGQVAKAHDEGAPEAAGHPDRVARDCGARDHHRIANRGQKQRPEREAEHALRAIQIGRELRHRLAAEQHCGCPR
jgi:hypothetical protein